MKYLSFILIMLLASVACAEDWQQELAEDMVTIKDDKMYIERYELLKTTAEDGTVSNTQVKLYSTSPTQVISRDNFVCITTMIYTLIIAEMLETVEFDIVEIDEPIGKVDMEINLYMTKEGFQIEVDLKTIGERTRETTKWSDFFESE